MIKNGKWVQSFRRKDSVRKVAAATIETRLAAVHYFFPLAVEQSGEDMEYVHQLRVATRRTSAALDLYAEFLPRKPLRLLRRQLKRIRRAAGNARDYDVLIDRHAHCEGDLPAEHFVAMVRCKRRDAQTPIAEVFRTTQCKGKLSRLAARLLRDLESDDSDACRPRFGRWAQKQLGMAANEFFRAQPRDLNDLESLHEFRIAGKRLRYTMELLVSAFPESFRTDLYPVVEQIQEPLGEINDHAVALHRFREWRKASKSRLDRRHLDSLMMQEKRDLKRAAKQFAKWWTPKRARRLRKLFRRITTF